MKKLLLIFLLVFVPIFLLACEASPVLVFNSPVLPPEPGDTAVLYGLLMQFISGGLAAGIVYKFLGSPIGGKLVSALTGPLSQIGLDSSEVTRYLAIILSGGVSFVAYLIAMTFQFVPVPTSNAAWVNLVLALLGVGFTGSQILHARTRPRAWERKRDRLIGGNGR
jgi:hypothetical protein